MRQVFRQLGDRGRRLRHTSGGQPLGDVPPPVCGLGQACGLGHVTQDVGEVGEVGEDLQVLVGLVGDPDHEVDELPRIPLEPRPGPAAPPARLADEAAILGDTVGNGDAVAQKGVGDRLPGQHALDVPGIDQNLADLTDRIDLVRCPGPDADRRCIESDHGIPPYRDFCRLQDQK